MYVGRRHHFQSDLRSLQNQFDSLMRYGVTLVKMYRFPISFSIASRHNSFAHTKLEKLWTGDTAVQFSLNSFTTVSRLSFHNITTGQGRFCFGNRVQQDSCVFGRNCCVIWTLYCTRVSTVIVVKQFSLKAWKFYPVLIILRTGYFDIGYVF